MKRRKVLHLISGGDTGGAKTHLSVLCRGLMEHADIKVICFIRDSFYDDLKAEGIDIEVFEQTARFDLSVVKRLAREVEEHSYDLVHCHGARANFIAMLLRKKVSVPFVTTIHSDYELDFRDRFYKKLVYTNLNKWALRSFRDYICVSDEFATMMKNRGFGDAGIHVVYNGIRTELPEVPVSKEDFLRQCGAEGDYDLIVGIVARLDEVKDHRTFLRAVEYANRQNPNLLYLIAGDGYEREALERIVREKGLDNVRFLGYIRDTASFYNAIDLNVLTSKSESFPYALLEGAIFGCPVVSTEVGGIPKLVDETTGMLFDVGDAERLSEIFLSLAKHPETLAEKGRNIRRRVEERFSMEAMAKSHLEIYEKILQGVKRNILMLGYYGFDNSGDDAILEAMVSTLRSLDPGLELTALSKTPEKTERMYGIRSAHRFKWWELRREMKRTDLFLFGGGTLLQDRTSTRSIRYYLYTLSLAKKYGKRTMIYANGLGPVSGSGNRRLTTEALSSATLVTLRDEASLRYAEELGVKNDRMVVTQDPVFALEPCEEARRAEICRAEGLPTDQPLIGISVRNWNGAEGLQGAVAETVVHLEKKGFGVVLIPMQQPHDVRISEDIRALATERGARPESIHVIRGVYRVEEMIGIISGMQAMIAMRLHAIIYAALSGVPPVGLSYAPKIEGVLEELELPAPLKVESLTGAALIRETERLLAHREELRVRLIGRLEEKREQAKENAKLAYELLKS